MSKATGNQLHIPEILAPAGTYAAMEAAVNAGCDAVYLGGNLFSARAFAGNFDREEMLRTIDYCHLFDVKVYMTVNTLLKEQEMPELVPYMQPFYEAGLDGVIVQDVGVLNTLREHFPDLPLHASTQMSISSAYGAGFLKRQGIRRVVPARELSLEEICAIRKKVDIEIETFVHGAMCYAFSGKCLFSSFLGGRSGNRGRCAQPCRKCYEVFSGFREMTGGKSAEKGHALAKEYIMSLKDMCTLSVLPSLIDAGIDSFKIEGRMKNPEYVAATVHAYRTARDAYLKDFRNAGDEGRKRYLKLADDLTKEMQDIYNRGGFYPGYYFQEKGLEMTAVNRPNHTGLLIGEIVRIREPEILIRLREPVHEQDVLEILQTGTELTSNQSGKPGDLVTLKAKELRKLKPGMQVYRTHNPELLQRINDEIIKPEKQIHADAVIRARIGEPLQILLTHASAQVTVYGNVIAAASSKPTDPETLAAKMQKTGGSHVEIQAAFDMDTDVFVPMSEFNQLRREAVEQLKAVISGNRYRKQS